MCMHSFLEAPRVQLRYSCGARQVVQELLLPLAPHKFMLPEPHIAKEAFFDKWKSYQGERAVSIALVEEVMPELALQHGLLGFAAAEECAAMLQRCSSVHCSAAAAAACTPIRLIILVLPIQAIARLPSAPHPTRSEKSKNSAPLSLPDPPGMTVA
jgi:hypothetical protein